MPELEYFDHDCNNYQRLSITTSTCQVVDDPNRPIFSAWLGATNQLSSRFPHCTEVDTVKGENTQLREELIVESWCVIVFTIPGNPQESLPCSILTYSLPQKLCFRREPLNWRYFQGIGRLPLKARDHERV